MSILTGQDPLGRVIRLPLRLVPSDADVRVLSGPVRGARWRVGSSVHGCWLGTYERSKADLFARMVHPGDVVYDVGGQAGYYTLLAARSVGSEGRVVVFEPLPHNAQSIRHHLTTNHVRNAELIEAAVADREGIARFHVGATMSLGRLAEEGDLEVRTVALDDLAGSSLPPPTVMKMDIEGGEVDALDGAARILEEYRPTIFLATHGPEIDRSCRRVLSALGYSLRELGHPSEILAVAGERSTTSA